MGSCTSISEQRFTNTHIKNEIPKWFPSENIVNDISSIFTIGKKIGDGITGSVYNILYKKTNTMCALKRVCRSNKYSEMQFITEVRCLCHTSHPSIIKYINIYMDNKYYYLILEKADYNLFELSNQKQYLCEKETKRITFLLLQSIVYIHSKDIVHRDIKPQNIVFKNNIPKLIDFADSEMIISNKIYSEFVGTIEYLSPERLRQHNANQLKKSDVWAIAVVAYEMYSGIHCFDGENKQQIFDNILNGEWKWKLDRLPSKEMQDFVQNCLCLCVKKRLSAEDALKHVWFDSVRNHIIKK